jgi:hypothetical protein
LKVPGNYFLIAEFFLACLSLFPFTVGGWEIVRVDFASVIAEQKHSILEVFTFVATLKLLRGKQLRLDF